jgi:D-alanyl-D-alanine carboxypeptidase/D-alanyl-D-alanine-endopeptidase (penicillin-binding protein 4)
MKLFVSAAALDTFGPDATFDTYLYVAGDDLWLIGSGDPATGDVQIAESRGEQPTDFLDRWADELIARGRTKFEGSIKYWEGALDDQRTHPSWDDEDLDEWYAAPIAGLNYNNNCIDFWFEPTTLGEPALVRSIPHARESVQIFNRSVTAEQGEPTITRVVSGGVTAFTIDGTVSAPIGPESKPVADPGRMFAEVVQGHLETRGILVSRGVERIAHLPIERTAATAVTMLSPARTHLKDILPRVNKNSQNLLAEGLSKQLGRTTFVTGNGSSVTGTWDAGAVALRAWLDRHRIEGSSFVMADGSGLSRHNRLTARQITDTLAVMYRSHHRDIYIASLARGGVDGTIRSRFKDVPNPIHAKTGYIGGVRALSGYTQTDSGQWLIFSIIYNDIPRVKGNISDTRPFEQLQDEAVRRLMKPTDADRLGSIIDRPSLFPFGASSGVFTNQSTFVDVFPVVRAMAAFASAAEPAF